MFFRRVLRRIGSYFLQGLLVTVPIAVTVFVIVRLFYLLDSVLIGVHPFFADFPGAGILALILIITLAGLFASTVIAQPLLNYFNNILERAPLVKTIYTAIKDLLSAFVGKKKRFTKPVLVKMIEGSDLEKPGFITQESLSDLGIEGNKVAVYLPHSYAFSGNLFIVPADRVTPLDATPADVMKFIISGGVTEIDQESKNGH